MRINQVRTVDSPRKPDQLRCAFRKHSWVSVSDRSTSRVEASKNRKICGRCAATTAAKSRPASSSAVGIVIGLSAVPAAITEVDGTSQRKFTAREIIAPSTPSLPKRRGRRHVVWYDSLRIGHNQKTSVAGSLFKNQLPRPKPGFLQF